jgi:hypothetical protein
MNKILAIILISFLCITTRCIAGDPGGPNIVWVNLGDSNDMQIDEYISDIVHAKEPMCWTASQSYIYKRTRPTGITNDLVKSALIQNNATSIKKLNYLLKHYSDGVVNGFDGIIAYSPHPHPRMIGLTTGRKKPEVDDIENTKDINKIEASFCMVMPDVVTKP